MIKVMLCDDHALIRRGIRDTLSDAPDIEVVGEADRRCPPAQAFAMHRAVRRTGTPSEVLVLPGSSHEGSTYGPPAGRLAHDRALVEWMRRWVLA